MRTVVGVFSDRAEADHVVRHLTAVGVPSDDVTVADTLKADGHEWSGAQPGGLRWPLCRLVHGVDDSSAHETNLPGSDRMPGPGSAVSTGFVAGLIALWIGSPAGATVTMLAGLAIGVTFGGLIAGMYRLQELTHEEIPLQAEAARVHGVVVAAHVDKPTAEETYRLMEEHGARALRTDVDAWKASGWAGTLVPDEPYPSDSTIRRHAA